MISDYARHYVAKHRKNMIYRWALGAKLSLENQVHTIQFCHFMKKKS